MTDLNHQVCLKFLHLHNLKGVDNPTALYRVSESALRLNNDIFTNLLSKLAPETLHVESVKAVFDQPTPFWVICLQSTPIVFELRYLIVLDPDKIALLVELNEFCLQSAFVLFQMASWVRLKSITTISLSVRGLAEVFPAFAQWKRAIRFLCSKKGAGLRKEIFLEPIGTSNVGYGFPH